MNKALKILFSICLILLLLASASPKSQVGNLRNNETDQKANSYSAEPQGNNIALQQLIQQKIAQASEARGDVNGTYEMIWEPNRIQGSVHSVAVHGSIVAIGAGYLYDNVIHIYRWNPSVAGEGGLTHVWETGDGVFKSDVLSLTFGDTDMDGYYELVSGCADGRIYVFEQRALFSTDPLYYQFQSVWNSTLGEIGKRVSSVVVDDLDSDRQPEIIAGTWNQKIYVYEYTRRYGSPGASSHRHYYDKVWDSGDDIKGLVNSVATGDTDADGYREVIAGASDNKVYIFENENDTSPEPFYPHVDNAYSQVWNSTNMIPGPVNMVAVDNNVDKDLYEEIVAVSSGHGVFAFDYALVTRARVPHYVMNKLMRATEAWETDPKVQWPLDNYIDVKVRGNKTDGEFEPPTAEIPSPYCDLPNPANATAMAGPPDNPIYNSIIGNPFGGHFYDNATLLNATATKGGIAQAVLDFGKDEEITGGGNIVIPGDLTLYGFEVLPKNVSSENFFVYVSKDGENFTSVTEGLLPITKIEWTYFGTLVRYFWWSVDVDSILNELGWEWFRYIKLETTTEVYIDAIEGLYLYRPVADAVSVAISWMSGLNTTSTDDTHKIIVGTTTGVLKVFSSQWPSYVQTWDSYRYIPLYKPGTTETRRRFSMGNDIWAISTASPVVWGYSPRFMVVGTYPKVAFIEVNSTTLEASSVWDTGNVLAKWTMAVDLVDIDGDGAKEVVVGSFDNNIYVFDHVYRNTYRRAWRSPNLKHNQTFWDHATDVIVGDYDSDGKIELVASTDNQTYPIIHVFENTSGNQFTASEAIELPKDSGPVTALALGDDLDGDSAKEIVATAQGRVHVLEKSDNTITATSILVSYLGQALALVTGDSDGDGIREIIVGGYDVYIGSIIEFYVIRYGFTSVLEHAGPLGWQVVWSAPSEHMMKGSSFSVLSLALDDQDNDNKTEIIVGHDFGINIYENIGNNNYEIAHFITSSASYPTYAAKLLLTLSDNYVPGPSNLLEAWITGWRTSSAQVVQLSNGTYVMVYTSLDPTIDKTAHYAHWNESRIFYGTSQDGVNWSSWKRVTNDNNYNPTWRYWLYYERNPSVVVTPTDEVWIAYEAKFVVPRGEFEHDPEEDNWVCVTKLGTAYPSLDLFKVVYKAVSPSIFWNSTSGTLGLTHLNYTSSGGVNMLYLTKSHWDLILLSIDPLKIYSYPVWDNIPQVQNSKIGAKFQAYTQETVFISDGSLAVTFDGFNKTAVRDSDVWFMTTNVSDTQKWNDPRLISLSTDYEYTPSIGVLKSGVLAVVYRRIIGANWQVYITASMNNGSSWTTPQRLPADTGQPYAPSVSGLVDGGFMYTFHTSTNTFLPISPKLYFAKNTLENWWRYTIGQVQCLATGDTNANQVNEIIAGSLNQTYILELTDIGGGDVIYTQKWVSQVFPQVITDVAVGDINNDGVNEIVFTTANGNLYAFSWKKQE